MLVTQDEHHSVRTEEDEEDDGLFRRVYPAGEESELSERECNRQPKRDPPDGVADESEDNLIRIRR